MSGSLAIMSEQFAFLHQRLMSRKYEEFLFIHRGREEEYSVGLGMGNWCFRHFWRVGSKDVFILSKRMSWIRS